MPKITDEYVALSYLRAGFPLETIAAKLGCSMGHLEEIFEGLKKRIEQQRDNGSIAFHQEVTTLLGLYEATGEQLKKIAAHLGEEVTHQDLHAMIMEDPETAADRILRSCIVRPAFVPPPVQEELGLDDSSSE